MKLPYGYRWIIRLIISRTFLLIWVLLVVPFALEVSTDEGTLFSNRILELCSKILWQVIFFGYTNALLKIDEAFFKVFSRTIQKLAVVGNEILSKLRTIARRVENYYDEINSGIESKLKSKKQFLALIAYELGKGILVLLFVLISNGLILFIIILLGIEYFQWMFKDIVENTSVSWLLNNWKFIVPENLIKIGIYLATPLIIAKLLIKVLEWSRGIKEGKLYRQLFKEGRGGSAEWATTATLQDYEVNLNSDSLILGRSRVEDDPKTRIIGLKGNNHVLTIGKSGSGKSTTVLFPNLANYRGSAIVFDPKGELADMTFRSRTNESYLRSKGIGYKKGNEHMSGVSYVLDPFKETKTGLPLSCYNILSEIDIKSDRVREILSAISDGMVLPEKGKNSDHFTESAKNFIEAMIVHVMTRYDKKHHNLPFIYDLIYGIDRELGAADMTRFDELLYLMLKNDAVGGLTQQVATIILGMGDNEKGSVLSTVARSIKWIGDTAMRKQLESSDFKFSTLNDSTQTVYYVLPEGLINEQLRWIRTLISVSLTLVKKSGKPKKPTLFVIDELPRLGGKIEAVSEGFAILRGYGINLWAFIQDIGQLKKDYPERWSSIVANSTTQIFGVKDMETAQWVSEMMGVAKIEEKESQGFLKKKKTISEKEYPLLTPDEVMNKLGENDNYQLVRTSSGFPFRLERCAFKPLRFGGKKFREFSPGAFGGCFEEY